MRTIRLWIARRIIGLTPEESADEQSQAQTADDIIQVSDDSDTGKFRASINTMNCVHTVR